MSRTYWKRDASVRPGAWSAALFVLGVAASLLLLGKALVTDMFHKTRDLGWVTPAGSPSLESGLRAQELFPMRMRGAIVMAVEALPDVPGGALTEVVAEFSRNVSARILGDMRTAQFEPFVVGYYLETPGGERVHDIVRQELVSPDGRTTVIVIQPTKLAGSWSDANSLLQEFCASPPHGYTLHITGMPAVLSGDGCFNGVRAHVNTVDMNFELIFKAELCTVPIALLIIGSMVQYVRLLLLPMMLVVVSFVLTSALTTPWMDSVPIARDVPAAVISVVMAICLDSSLFFLSAFSEQHTAGWSLQRNVDAVTRSIGHTVFVSGTLVMIAFFGSMVLPEENLQGSGFCMGVAAIACMTTSILLMPSLLLVAGKTLTGTVFRNSYLQPVELSGFRGEREELQEEVGPGKEVPTDNSHWLTMMRLIDRSPVGAVVTVLLLMSPVLAFLPELNISGDLFAIMPMEMPALQAMRRIQRDFPLGILEPFAVVITAPDANIATELVVGTNALGHSRFVDLAAKLGLRRADADSVVAAASELGAVASAAPAAASARGNCSAPAVAYAAGLATRTTEEGDRGAAPAEDVSDAARESALRAAVRVASSTGCSVAAVQEAVAAVAAALYSGRGEVPDAVGDTVRDEASKLGLAPAAAEREAGAALRAVRRGAADPATVAGAASTVEADGGGVPSCATLAAAAAGAAAAGAARPTSATASSIDVAEVAFRASVSAAAVAAAKCAGGSGAAAPQALREALAAAGTALKVSGGSAAADAGGPRGGVAALAARGTAADLNLGANATEAFALAARLGAEDAAAERARLWHEAAGECTALASAAAVASAGLSSAALGDGAGPEKAQEAAKRAAEAAGCGEAATLEAIAAAERALHARSARLAIRRGVAATEAAASHVAANIEAEQVAGGGAVEVAWPSPEQLLDAAADLAAEEHGALLMPSGYAAMLDLCDRLKGSGNIASMLGPSWVLHQPIDWLSATALRASPSTRALYGPMLDSHVRKNVALLEVHTTFPSVGAGAANWVMRARSVLQEWEAANPGFKAELSGGASEAADTRHAVLGAMGKYLFAIVPLIMTVVFASFRSALVPLRLAFALFFTLAATYGVAVIIYQTPLMHGLFPWLAPFDGLTYEVVPMVTGIAIALGLDYDIFLVSRIVEFRKRGFSDRAAIFRGAAKAGGVISGAGIIMSLAFAGLCFSDKLLMQQFGVLLIVSVVFDTYVVRTVLVPALMLMAQEWNWWPQKMPPGIHTSLEGDVDSENSLCSPMLKNMGA